MIGLVKRFWHYISYLGIDDEFQFDANEQKRRIFFNKCHVIAIISFIVQIPLSHSFIGNYAYINFITALLICSSLIIHSKGYYTIAKRVMVYSIFICGAFLTAISGGDFLYHLGVITVVTFSWLIFDIKKELIEIIVFVLITVFIFAIGEFNLFNAPDFSNHPDTATTRLIGLFTYTVIVIIFIYFMRRLNETYEDRLSTILEEKEALLSEVLIKTKALEIERQALEDVVLERTAELSSQREFLIEQNSIKEVLLKEVHHRVKNNLQIVVSLLNLQAANFEDENVLRAIRETQNRVVTMSLVHKRMYQTSNFAAIGLGNYINLLIENNKMLHVYDSENVTFENNCIPLRVDIDSAIPIGLIINEMITNSFKYAFNVKRADAKIQIDLKILDETGTFELTYRDNGPGLPKDFKLENSSTLGLQLIEALVEQINGTLSHKNDNGAVFIINFRLPKLTKFNKGMQVSK